MRGSILIGVILSLVAAMFISKQVFSAMESGHELKVIHKTIHLTHNDLTRGVVLDHQVKSLAASQFHISSAAIDNELVVRQFIATVSQQAIHEGWNSLLIDVWVGGETSPAGYFFRYKATDSTGSKIQGGAFVVTDLPLINSHLSGAGFANRYYEPDQK